MPIKCQLKFFTLVVVTRHYLCNMTLNFSMVTSTVDRNSYLVMQLARENYSLIYSLHAITSIMCKLISYFSAYAGDVFALISHDL